MNEYELYKRQFDEAKEKQDQQIFKKRLAELEKDGWQLVPPTPRGEIECSYYVLQRVDFPKPRKDEFRFLSAAVMSCLLCKKAITGMGGPGEGICIDCGDLIKSRQVEMNPVLATAGEKQDG